MKTTQRKSSDKQQAPKGKQRAFLFRGGIEKARMAKLTEKNKVKKGIKDFRKRLSRVRELVEGVYREYQLSRRTDFRFRTILQAYMDAAVDPGPVGVRFNRIKTLAGKFKRLLQQRGRIIEKLDSLRQTYATLHRYCGFWIDAFQKYVRSVGAAKSVRELEAVPFPNTQGLEKIGDDFGADALALVAQWDNMALLVKMDEYTNLLGYLIHPGVQQEM